MQAKVIQSVNFEIPVEIITAHYFSEMPEGFAKQIVVEGKKWRSPQKKTPTLYTAHLPKVLEWLHGSDIPRSWEKEPCETPVLIYDNELTFDRLLFHYDGTPASARLIHHFIGLFSLQLKNSKATIISPSFIPKSKLKEEQEVIQAVSQATAETSFIKFNFNRIGDFWSYAVKHECTLLITTKYYQADLAKVLFHFYKGGMWYDRLSFYLSL
ncbi:hypothetical protein [Lunatibacter salilacus]|uniref:hypothetical protein n=1 Tax=Lunatibacter salilacus TaxID=2483804 RepID=UPI00131DF49B|nr:hypothetical protein [Lunatibacter salilacus]